MVGELSFLRQLFFLATVFLAVLSELKALTKGPHPCLSLPPVRWCLASRSTAFR